MHSNHLNEVCVKPVLDSNINTICKLVQGQKSAKKKKKKSSVPASKYFNRFSSNKTTPSVYHSTAAKQPQNSQIFQKYHPTQIRPVKPNYFGYDRVSYKFFLSIFF